MPRRLAAALLCLSLSVPAMGWEFWSSEGGEETASLQTALKWTSVLSYAPDDPILFPERWGSVNAWRLRLGLEARLRSWMGAELAYEHRAQSLSKGASVSALLPAGGGAPYRICQLDWPLVEVVDSFDYRHEIDRASVSFSPEWGEVTIGRQAVGWGRGGVLFSAVDIFSPFTPLEVDREWRRGIDAARADVRLADTYSLDVVAAFGENWGGSALVGRFRGYSGAADGEIIFGKRAEDWMYAATLSSAVGGAELHGEIAVFDTPDDLAGEGLFGTDNLVGKAVLGGSYTFDVGNALTVFIEYHYSGFGASSIEDAVARLDPTDLEYPNFEWWRDRLARGDMQMLGRHAVALQAAYGINDEWSSGLMWLQSLADGSGLVAASLTWDFAENVSLLGSAYLPYGAPPESGEPKSEYGAAPASAFLQVCLYY